MTYQEILDSLNDARKMQFSNDPEREEFMRKMTTLTLATLLAKLSEEEQK